MRQGGQGTCWLGRCHADLKHLEDEIRGVQIAQIDVAPGDRFAIATSRLFVTRAPEEQIAVGEREGDGCEVTGVFAAAARIQIDWINALLKNNRVAVRIGDFGVYSRYRTRSG
jgi:hypothetical protein